MISPTPMTVNVSKDTADESVRARAGIIIKTQNRNEKVLIIALPGTQGEYDHPVVFLRGQIFKIIVYGIDLFRVEMDLIVEMRASAAAIISHKSYLLAPLNILPLF